LTTKLELSPFQLAFTKFNYRIGRTTCRKATSLLTSVMEPFAALGVVSNAIQLIDFSTKLISKTKSLQRSGSLVEQEDLLLVSKDLASITDALMAELGLTPAGITGNDIATRSLCEKCLEVALETETALVDTKERSTVDRWKSFLQALKAIWGAEMLADMQGRLMLLS
jgi:hypothetical protein